MPRADNKESGGKMKVEKSQDVMNIGAEHLLELDMPELRRMLNTLNEKPQEEWDNVDNTAHERLIRVMQEKHREAKEDEKPEDNVELLKQIEQLPCLLTKTVTLNSPEGSAEEFKHYVDLASIRELLKGE